jgi:hypothetical protein
LRPAASPSAPTAEEVAAESARLTAYLNAEYEEELVMNPMDLTTMGRKELYDQLGDFSEAARAETARMAPRECGPV